MLECGRQSWISLLPGANCLQVTKKEPAAQVVESRERVVVCGKILNAVEIRLERLTVRSTSSCRQLTLPPISMEKIIIPRESNAP